MAALKYPFFKRAFLDDKAQKNTVKLLGAWKNARVIRALLERQEMTLSQQ